MRRSHMDVIVAAVAAAISTATLVFYGGPYADLSSMLQTVISRAAPIVPFAAVFGGAGWWTVHTWRRLWRPGRSAWERVTYDLGVRGVGLSMASVLVVVITWCGWTSDSSGRVVGPFMIGGLLAGLVVGVPVALHFGYVVGTVFAAIVGLRRDRNVDAGEPPHFFE